MDGWWMNRLCFETSTLVFLGRQDDYRLLRKHEDYLEEKSIAAANSSKLWVMKRLLSTSLSSFTLGLLHIRSSNTHQPCLSYQIKSCAYSVVRGLEIKGGAGGGNHIEMTEARPLYHDVNVFVHVLPNKGTSLCCYLAWQTYLPPIVTQYFIHHSIPTHTTLYLFTFSVIHSFVWHVVIVKSAHIQYTETKAAERVGSSQVKDKNMREFYTTWERIQTCAYNVAVLGKTSPQVCVNAP